ncbi:Serine/threonine-protein kinase [Elaphomyces granulatus]
MASSDTQTSLQDIGKARPYPRRTVARLITTPWLAVDVEEGAEPVEQYITYPMISCIGDVLEDTYIRIEHKLDHGESSTASDIKKKDVARRTLPILDNHRVLVFPVRGPSFSDTLELLSMDNMNITSQWLPAARQLLKALECLHKAGIILCGVSPSTISTRKLNTKYLGRPLKIALPSDLWRQGELVKRLEVPKSLITDTIYLGDFGLATKAGTDVRHKMLSHLNIVFYAPERFHNVNPSFASDMWSYIVLGPLPKQWKGCYNSYVTTFSTCDNSWYDQRKKPKGELTLESLIKRERPEVSSVERNHLLNIMSKGFCYSPEDRLSATELLQDPSFQAIMEIHCR